MHCWREMMVPDVLICSSQRAGQLFPRLTAVWCGMSLMCDESPLRDSDRRQSVPSPSGECSFWRLTSYVTRRRVIAF